MAAIIGRPVMGWRREEWRLAARVSSRFLAALGITGRETKAAATAKAAGKVQAAEKARRSRFPKGMTERKAQASAEAKTEAGAEAKA
jgi:hypothetical protein